ncbi:MAG: type III-A CRISPR-associated RAMP protein Csm4 [Desulfatibacillaceae bacterium]|nr:type III-A CRISPR-associated RAMP protein Csm4 [Desulfatibacillaceae bacterium]
MLPETGFAIRPLAPLHLGEDGDLSGSASLVRADTLWSALVTLAFETGRGELVDILKDPKRFLVSSAFPAWEDIRFLVRPFVRPNWSAVGVSANKTEPEPDRKKLKSVWFVSEKLFHDMIKGRPVCWDDTVSAGHCAMLKSEVQKRLLPDWITGSATVTGNVVDRLTSMADLFDRSDLFVNVGEGAYLYFRARMEPDFQKAFLSLLQDLGRRGIGGERSIGKGAFEADCLGTLSALGEEKPTSRFATLSPYYPTGQEVSAGALEKASYELVAQGGWVGTTGLRRKKIRMLKEGSVASAVPGKEFSGEIPDVRPNNFPNPVWRYGMAYPVFLLEETQ